ncbi:MAG: hypothetical protein ACREPD_10970 [Stenotrophomonas sp.]|uniref:hypothetical protein n=1 Tax=Stenotrophomonas sp. TaxID=69392 RepID=UPI003D6C8DB5
MTADEYLALMQFPKEWKDYGLIPEDLLSQLIATYQPGMENSSEHDRNGAFHWWLKRSPDETVLAQLVTLSYLDPDQLMAADVRSHIALSPHADSEVRGLLRRDGA